ncbi:MAG: arginine--tRNA ligase, partial [Candidatus Omnitrophota bacterium]
MGKDIQHALISIIQQALKELKLNALHKEPIYIDLPANAKFGDLSTNIALVLSKAARKPPVEIARSLADHINRQLERSSVRRHIAQVKVEGAGFLNFYFSEEYLYGQLKAIVVKKEKQLKVNYGRSMPVLLEFVSANPTGPLSVAHARQAAVGDVLANILDFLGFKVKREYYLNDEGNQINILGESVRLRREELNGGKTEFPENHYQGEYIFDIAREAGDRIKSEDLGEFSANYILEIIKKELDDFGINFDYWYSQKSLRESGKINKALDFLKKKGYLYEQDGATWFKSTQFQDDKDRVVIKSDGSYTYLAPDIAYHLEKYKRGFKRLINLWGPDHHGYINRLRAAVMALGYPRDSLSVVIVQLASIYKEGKLLEMSTRKGQYITLREVLDEVGRDTSRFFFLMRRTSSHLDFDLDIAKKQTPENPVYYVQYAYARIASILRTSPIKPGRNADLELLKEKEELGLIKKL